MSIRRRPNSIGADEARAWARQIKLGNPYAKAILMAIANYMNEDGTAWPGIETIANDTEIAANTIVSRQRWLADIGCISLSRCWLDENGRRNKDGRGRPTSSEIRFLFDADLDAIEAAAQSGEAKALRGAAKKSHEERVSPTPGDEQNSTQEQGVSPSLTPQQPPTAAPAYIDESLEGEDSPQTPLSGGLEEKPDLKGQEEAEARWQQFKAGYPDGIVDPAAAKAQFTKLSEADQLGAIAGLPIYSGRLKARREKSIKAHLYLKKTTWEGLLASLPAEGAPLVGGPYDPRSEAGRAILALVRIARSSVPRMGDGRLIYTKPITPQLLALAQAKPGGAVYSIGTGNYRSWFDFLKASLSLVPRLDEIEAPWPYPPSTSGKIYDSPSATGPPPERVEGTLATQQDLKEFAKG